MSFVSTPPYCVTQCLLAAGFRIRWLSSLRCVLRKMNFCVYDCIRSRYVCKVYETIFFVSFFVPLLEVFGL